MELDNQGWISLHRKFIKWEWYKKPAMVHLFIHLLLLANHEEGKWQGHTIKRGQLITGLKSLKQETGISHQSLRTCLARLKSTGEITYQTTNQFRLITIVNYDKYQTKNTNKLTSQLTNEQQATNKPLTTNNNNKQLNNVNKERRFTPPSLTEVEQYLTTMKYGLDAQDFLDKNEASGWVMNGGKKVKDWKAHARSWETRRKKWAGETFNLDSLHKLLQDFKAKQQKQGNWTLYVQPSFKDYHLGKLEETINGIYVFDWEETELVKKAILDKELHKFLS